ncbi:amino acid adenylation domain-containing protein [Streptomyces sp. NPDC002054]|uniref:amino acid adenylation domain-containing protein n=1 Tax=Streptomyces sp. NPDC002054 TaxID=3154663 RepID=UPI00333084C2
MTTSMTGSQPASEPASESASPAAPEAAASATGCAGVHRLVEGRARRTPDALAVLCGDRRISYAELDRRAGRLARLLRRRGVGPEVPVGLFLDRSADLAVGVLAVLKAGGVCVPLDPSYPAERLAFIREDVAAALVLTRRDTAAAPALRGAEVLCLDADADAEAGTDADEPEAAKVRLHPQNLAWIAYTSGSTGRPKGVGLAHGPLADLARHIGGRLDLEPADRVLQFASPGFSVAAEEILSTWAAGACLVIDPDDSLADAAGLLAVTREQAVTVLQLTPAYWYEWLRELDRDGTPHPPDSLRLLVVGSEQVAPDRVADWLPSGVRLVQEYGATEGTVSQLLYEPHREDAAALRRWPRVPIGTPLPGIRVHVLDERLRPVPDGEPGELYLAGPCLARGYLGRPALTAGRFLPDPYAERPGDRMYRTGDLARRRPDGALEFLGRADHQIKIRGVRIEPGEVETAIGRHPGVAGSAVMARTTASGTDQLCALVVWEEGRADEAGLRDRLRRTLAPALVPARIVAVPDLPLNPHGKVDRRALRDLPLGPTQAEPGAAAPRTPLEAALAGVWAFALGLPRVGAEDDFFALGGDSLTATRLAAHLREVLAVDARQRMLFEAPTVRALAALLPSPRPGTGAASAGTTEGASRAPLTPAQRRMWLLHRMAPSSTAYHEPVVLRLRGPLDERALTEALRRAARRHAALRTTLGDEDGRPVQIIAPPETADTLTPARYDLTGRPEAELHRTLAEWAATPFDLRRGPLLRTALLRVAPDEQVLALVLHHIVFDGWSSDVLFRDLAALYEESRTGAGAALPPLPVPYAQVCADEDRQQTGSTGHDRQLAHWKRKLADAPPLTTLPGGRPAPGATRVVRHAFRVRPEAAARLRELAAAEHATPFMVLLAGFKALVHRAGGARDLVVGTLLAGRDRPETADMIGLFTRTVALRTRLPEQVTFRGLVRAVRDTLQEALAHQDVPFERIVEELRPPRDRRHNPVFQLMFSYGGTTVRAPAFPGLTVTPVPVDTGGAKFGATVMLEADEDGGYRGLFECDPAHYDELTARRHTEDFASLLARLAQTPDASI